MPPSHSKESPAMDKATASLVRLLNSGGNQTNHLQAWAAKYKAEANAAFKDEDAAANAAAIQAKKDALKAQLAAMEA